jgi:hypothetical protein
MSVVERKYPNQTHLLNDCLVVSWILLFAGHMWRLALIQDFWPLSLCDGDSIESTKLIEYNMFLIKASRQTLSLTTFFCATAFPELMI